MKGWLEYAFTRYLFEKSAFVEIRSWFHANVVGAAARGTIGAMDPAAFVGGMARVVVHSAENPGCVSTTGKDVGSRTGCTKCAFPFRPGCR
jgi:hypothetical protein